MEGKAKSDFSSRMRKFKAVGRLDTRGFLIIENVVS